MPFVVCCKCSEPILVQLNVHWIVSDPTWWIQERTEEQETTAPKTAGASSVEELLTLIPEEEGVPFVRGVDVKHEVEEQAQESVTSEAVADDGIPTQEIVIKVEVIGEINKPDELNEVSKYSDPNIFVCRIAPFLVVLQGH